MRQSKAEAMRQSKAGAIRQSKEVKPTCKYATWTRRNHLKAHAGVDIGTARHFLQLHSAEVLT
jgi:hypothetical protein